MTPEPFFRSDDGRVMLYCGDAMRLLPLIQADCIITDPPFSERTHAGHDSSANGHAGEGNDFADRQSLGYSAWSAVEVAAFCRAARCEGWIVVITDHTLARAWEQSLDDIGRYVFAPLPHFSPGRAVRLAGDGPSSWTDQIVVARTKAQSKWGTLPGGYVTSPDKSGDARMGGKPVALMSALVRDYSRPGDLVCDPCAGMATTGIACIRLGRRFVGVEIDPAVCEAAADRLRRELSQFDLIPPAEIHSQESLLP